jgi:hypothetical protein
MGTSLEGKSIGLDEGPRPKKLQIKAKSTWAPVLRKINWFETPIEKELKWESS